MVVLKIVKEVKGWESSDGMRHDTYEKAVERENTLEFYNILDAIAYQNGEIKGLVEPSELWFIKDQLIQFFVDKGYVKEIKIGVTSE